MSLRTNLAHAWLLHLFPHARACARVCIALTPDRIAPLLKGVNTTLLCTFSACRCSSCLPSPVPEFRHSCTSASRGCCAGERAAKDSAQRYAADCTDTGVSLSHAPESLCFNCLGASTRCRHVRHKSNVSVTQRARRRPMTRKSGNGLPS